MRAPRSSPARSRATGIDHARWKLEAEHPELKARPTPSLDEAMETLRRFADLTADPELPPIKDVASRRLVDHENLIRLWLAPHIAAVLGALPDRDSEDDGGREA